MAACIYLIIFFDRSFIFCRNGLLVNILFRGRLLLLNKLNEFISTANSYKFIGLVGGDGIGNLANVKLPYFSFSSLETS